MNIVIRSKAAYSITNEIFQQVYSHIEDYVSRAELEDMLDRAAEKVRSDLQGRTAAIAWSGGKDTLALWLVMERAGITRGLLSMSYLEYPFFEEYVARYKPAGIEIVRCPLDLEWLAANPRFLFPPWKSPVVHEWMRLTRWNVYPGWIKKSGSDVLVLGRRNADGNVTGGGKVYTRKDGLTQYCPLYDWPHEAVLAALRYYDIPLPFFYGLDYGWVRGTGAWPESGSMTWAKLYAIDGSIVVKAARLLPGARDFLNSLEKA